MNKECYYYYVTALEVRSLLSEGWIYVGKIEDASSIHQTFRHPNGNRCSILTTTLSCEIRFSDGTTKLHGTQMC